MDIERSIMENQETAVKKGSAGSSYIYDKAAVVLYPLVLLLFPLLQISRGVELADSTCSLANYMKVEHLDAFWRYGYYLSLEIGQLMTRLPFGHTLLGMNLYTGLVISILALVSYFFLSRRMPKMIAFLGVLIACGLSWCPSLILYNYLTYLFFDVAVILLYLAMTVSNEKKQAVYFILAGVCLALNAFVRFPNIMEVILIVVVWIHAYLTRRSDGHGVRNTLYCIAGYAAGAGIGFVLIALTGRITDFFAMIEQVLFLSDNASGYSFADMLRAIVTGYLVPYKFEIFMLAAIAAGVIFFSLWNRLAGKKAIGDHATDDQVAAGNSATAVLLRIFQVLYVAAVLGMFVWFYKRGLFVFHYSSYDSMIKLAAIFLTLSWGCILYAVVSGRESQERRVFALLIAVVMLITPLGSNNGIYPIVNNLFLVAPFTLSVLFGLTKRFTFPVKIVLGTFLVLLLIQSMLFGTNFRFRDGIDGEKMNTKVEGIEALQGMWTTEENAGTLESLAAYLDSLMETTESTESTESAESAGERQTAILYGAIPGLFYLLDLEPATTALWIDLDTNSVEALQADLQKWTDLNAGIGQNTGTDENAGMAQNAVRMPLVITTVARDVMLQTNEKEIQLAQFLIENGYQESFRNERYIVWNVQ